MNKSVKRQISLLLMMVMLIAVFSGCESSTPAPSQAPTESSAPAEGENAAPGERTSYMLGTASTGGYVYQWGTAISALVNQYSEHVHLTAQVTAGSAENIERIRTGGMDIGVVSNDFVLKYYTGDEVEAYTDARIVYVSPGSVMSLVVLPDADIQTIYDLRGKRVDLGPLGGGSYESNINILDALGIGISEFKEFNMSTNDGSDALKAGQIDARITQSVGSSWIEELSTSRTGLRMISLSDEDVDKVLEKYPTYEKIVLPAGYYTGIDYEVQGPGRRYSLLVNASFPEEHAYEIAKILYEHYDELVANLATAADTTLEATVASSEVVAPMHPGTEKLAKEVGLIS